MSTQCFKARPAWGASEVRRDHPTKGVAPAVQIDARGGKPKSVQTEFASHPSTPLHQLVGNSAGGHATTSLKLPSHPIVANPETPRATKAAPVSWGMGSAPYPHRPEIGDAVLLEALPSGSARLDHGNEKPHSVVTKK